RPSDDVVESVVYTGGIRRRIMDLIRRRFRSRAPGGEIAVADRTQRFAELFVMRVVAVERERPRLLGGLSFVAEPISATAQKFTDFAGTVEGELGRRRAALILVVANNHRNPVEADRIERVFVGEIVADVDRQHAARLVDMVSNPGQRGALVPVDIR